LERHGTAKDGTKEKKLKVKKREDLLCGIVEGIYPVRVGEGVKRPSTLHLLHFGISKKKSRERMLGRGKKGETSFFTSRSRRSRFSLGEEETPFCQRQILGVEKIKTTGKI